MALLATITTAQANPLSAVKAASFDPNRPDCPPDTTTLTPVKVPDPNDPTKYSVCSFFFAAKYSCPEGEVFDEIVLECGAPKPQEEVQEEEPSAEPEEEAEESPQAEAGLPL
ncbi:carbohydrate-binding module family 14 protein [Streptomyces sp. IBSBF 3136]|uniref:carbohydrate-binding module family 14 protein n=1 Tax=Streptomyces sp. IBSBF 3136 TaxID=2903524 RepID=UPI002FDBB248